MGKVGQRSNSSAGTSSAVHGSARRRLIKVTSSGGSRKPRGSSGKLAPPPPLPPPQSLVLDEDSGFGGDQSLDAEPALNYSPALSPPALSSSSVLSSSTAHSSSAALSSSVPHPISLSLTGLPAVSKSSHLSSLSSSAALSQLSLSTPLSLGSSGSLANLSSILPSLAMVPQACVDKLVPGVCPKNEPGIMDMGGEEAQELPTSSTVSAISSSIPPLISFRDVSLLSSLHTFKGNSSNNSSLLCVDGGGGKLRSGGGGKGGNRPGVPPSPPLLTAQLSPRSSDGSVELRLERQPEEQHRARYQTEGSRGAVKDRSGAGHPTVKLVGYNKRTTLQVFVGSDTGKCGPHMFYQVCRVTGKNSTPCRERRVEGTAVIETVLDPDTEMTMSCDCVGILKERNVDVEHRFKSALSRGRKKSTKCRLVFRAFVTLPSGIIETLQIVSHPIACTQPPGVPEICRKSLNECGVAGGDEMFILGKNFLKDALVVFQHRTGKIQPIWEERVLPDKDTLQPIHLVVKVPGYCDQSIRGEVTVDVMVSSGGRTSESHPLTFLPTPAPSAPVPAPAPALSQSTKRELTQMNDTWEDKPLPKGVSPCALQLNRHYTETGMMPSSLPDFTSQPTAAPTQLHVNTTQVCVSGAPSSVKTSRVVLNTTKKVVSSGLGLLPLSSQPNQTPDQNGGPGPQQPAPGDNLFKQESGGSPGVSLEVVVEMLKVIQKFPAGSPIHTSVLQLVERLLQSMRDNLPQNKLTPNPTASYDQLLTQPSPITPTLDKSSKFLDHLTPSQPQLPLVPSGTLTTGTMPMTTSVSLLPLTVLSALPSTVYAGPKVARVAPVAPVAPTTVVSSPALTRTVRVCVAEEPPLKKAREETVAGSANYQLMSGNQCSTFTPDLSTTTILAHKVPITTPDTLPTPTPTTRHQDLSTPHQVLSSSLVPTHQLTHPSFASTLHTVYQPFLQTLPAQPSTTQLIHPEIKPLSDTNSLSLQQSHTNSLTPPQPNTQLLSHHTPRQNLMVQQTSDQSLTRIPTRQTTLAMHHIPQQNIIVQQAPRQQSLNVSGNTKGSSHSHNLSVDSSVSGEVSDPLLSQAPLCPLLPPPTTQKTLPSTNCPSSSALTRSDPLLSQSSPVTPLRMEARPGLPAVRTEGTAGEQVRTRPDSLMTPTPPTTTAQVTMQNEVTSAINLSETELLNYFDPNCFDNV